MWSNSDCPVIPKATVFCALITGTTAAASSDVRPITSARFDVVANSCRTAGTASAGSPFVSTDLQLSWLPSTPPALLIAFDAASQATRYVGPSAASAPVNGATSAIVREPALRAAVAPAETTTAA